MASDARTDAGAGTGTGTDAGTVTAADGAPEEAQRPVALVTGTSTGIGLATAVAAAQAGFQVVATVRRAGSEAELLTTAEAYGVADRVAVRMLDTTDAAAAESLVNDVAAQYGRLDAVVNNAGSGHVGTVEEDSLDAIRAVMEVNYFGVVNVTKAAMAHLRASSGSVVTVSSVGGVVGQPFNEAYCAAKFAVEGMMESLHPVAAAVGVRVVIVEPGPVATSFVDNVGVGESAVRASGPYGEAFDHYIERTRGAFANAQEAQGVADVIVGALIGDDVPLRLQSSDAATAFAGMKLRDLDGSVVTGATAGWVV
ncbi:SDR family NAD(P)-dependent oxidoreductase [Subtercola endophyticus]|uniref:SDR family NAD(P)-dependent oxidoreductase n=1 Tax=Subtercola endophyticus TaxID=2895559 RepID=UPI001E2EC3FE|nr:SDR family NAD(P)-dependent oxidoreductase [Subtercola endophyticus]UFS59766.1 SDR family NAD(P)-dependent oxidoreductase [Subtercola endophyticus]